MLDNPIELLMVWAIVPILTITIVISFIRLVRGPSLPDRVVAIDMIAVVTVGLMVSYAVAADQPTFLDVALIVALISFLGTIGFAYYIDRRS